MKRQDNEHKLQCNCIKWYRYQYPQFSNLLFAIPNGGQRNIIVATKMKAEGTLSGIPDLFLAKPKGNYAGLFIEMKYGKNRPTENQIYQMELLRQSGYRVEVCYSFDEFVNIIENYLKI